MSCYENLVMKTQMNYSRHYSTYASGGTAVVLSKQKPLPYEEQIQEFVRRVQEAECIIVGGACLVCKTKFWCSEICLCLNYFISTDLD